MAAKGNIVKVKSPSGKIMVLNTVVASGLVGGADKWEYVGDEGSKEPKSEAKGGEPESFEKGQKAPTGLIGTSDKPVQPATEQAGDPVPDENVNPEDALPKPDGRASQATWAAYAESRGYKSEDLERMSKSEIRELFTDDQE